MTPEEFVDRYQSAKETILTPAEMAELANGDFRRRVYAILHANVGPQHRHLLRCMLAEEIRLTHEAEWGIGDELCWCGFLLSRIGNIDDVPLLWKAKTVNFDTHCGFDIQFLVGAGVEATIAFLKQKADPESAQALEYITECNSSGDFEDLSEWREGRQEYFDG